MTESTTAPPAADAPAAAESVAKPQPEADAASTADAPTDAAPGATTATADTTPDAAPAAADAADAADAAPVTPAEESDASRAIAAALGDAVALVYRRGEAQLDAAEPDKDADRLQAAAATFVEALNSIPEDKQSTPAFAEVALMYGRALTKYIEAAGTGSSKLVNKVVKAALAGAASGTLAEDDVDAQEPAEGDKVEANGAEKKDATEEKKAEDAPEDSKEDDKKEGADTEEKKDDSEDKVEAKPADDKAEAKGQGGYSDDEDLDETKDEDEDSEIAWANIEAARIIFGREKQTQRLALCHASLGFLLLVTDEGKQAADEYQKACTLYEDARLKADCMYHRCIALRIEDKPAAAEAMRSAIKLYEGLGEGDRDESVLTELRGDLKQIEEQIKEENPEKKNMDVKVVSVQPKRKRDVEASKNDKPAEDVKKPRVEEVTGR